MKKLGAVEEMSLRERTSFSDIFAEDITETEAGIDL
jgi:hypothetical protein